MNHPLDDSYAKVERAKEQLAELWQLIASWDKEPLRVFLGENPATGELLAKIPEVPVLPPRWSILVGEIAHNLRSALDYVVYQLADDPDNARTAFPIARSKRAYSKSRSKKKPSYRDRCLKGVPEKWARWIDRLQPFESPMPIERMKGLLILNYLSNRDKHRVRLPVFTLIELPFAILSVEDGEVVKDIEVRSLGRELHVKCQARRPARKTNRMVLLWEPKLPPNNSFGTREFAFGRDRIKFQDLSLMATYVRFIVGSFEPAFRPAARAN